MTTITVYTMKELTDKLLDFSERFPDELSQAIWEWEQLVLNESAKQCPVDTGYLRGSRYAEEPVVVPGLVRAHIGYSAEYAWYVHEDLEAEHRLPTKAKFLEDPLTQLAPTMVQNIISRVETMLGGR